jgi:hypothetical protein
VTLETAQDLIEKHIRVCPYSNATRGNMEVILTVSNEEFNTKKNKKNGFNRDLN